mgnify:CR=1 FL=1
MKCSKCGKEIINIQKASCISGYDEKGKHENWLCEKCSSEWDKEHPCYPIDYVKKSITDFVCKKCGSTEYEIKDKPNGTGIAHGLYCAKCGFWHKWLNKEELKQYGKKDSNGEIFSRLQAENAELTRKARQLTEENAALRERLGKAVELPCRVGDKVYCIHGMSNPEMLEWQVNEIRITDHNYMLQLGRAGTKDYRNEASQFYGKWWFTELEAALARLAELKGEKK